MEDKLIARLMELVPDEFFRYIAARQDLLYREAQEMAYRETLWRGPEAAYMVGHFRRALFENLLRESAELSGLSVVDNQHAGDNVGYVLVTAPGTEFTIHSVDNPNRFVRECVSRKQHAAVNRLVDGYLDGTLRQNPPRLDGEKPVYHLILHGTEERTDESGKLYRSTFLRVAIPDAELKRYRRNYNVPEILQWYASTEVNASKVKSLDLARPTPKRKRKDTAE